jgi:ribose 5-phosphate isomerase RpiB
VSTTAQRAGDGRAYRGVGLADEIVALWLKTPLDGRHQRRIERIADAGGNP